MTSTDCVKVECAGKLLDSQIAINEQYFVFAFDEFLMLNCLDFKLVEVGSFFALLLKTHVIVNVIISEFETCWTPFKR